MCVWEVKKLGPKVGGEGKYELGKSRTQSVQPRSTNERDSRGAYLSVMGSELSEDCILERNSRNTTVKGGLN